MSCVSLSHSSVRMSSEIRRVGEQHAAEPLWQLSLT